MSSADLEVQSAIMKFNFELDKVGSLIKPFRSEVLNEENIVDDKLLSYRT
jgi:hypothetical protein